MFSEHDKDCVTKLWHLGQGEQPSPEARHLVLGGRDNQGDEYVADDEYNVDEEEYEACLFDEAAVTDGAVESSSVQAVQKLGKCSSKANLGGSLLSRPQETGCVNGIILQRMSTHPGQLLVYGAKCLSVYVIVPLPPLLCPTIGMHYDNCL